jgi:hypothetical protein
MIQGGWTAGSTTSETSCEAVRQSCAALVERLKPIKEDLEAKSGMVAWSSLIAQVTTNLLKFHSLSNVARISCVNLSDYHVHILLV